MRIYFEQCSSLTLFSEGDFCGFMGGEGIIKFRRGRGICIFWPLKTQNLPLGTFRCFEETSPFLPGHPLIFNGTKYHWKLGTYLNVLIFHNLQIIKKKKNSTLLFIWLHWLENLIKWNLWTQNLSVAKEIYCEIQGCSSKNNRRYIL